VLMPLFIPAPPRYGQIKTMGNERGLSFLKVHVHQDEDDWTRVRIVTIDLPVKYWRRKQV